MVGIQCYFLACTQVLLISQYALVAGRLPSIAAEFQSVANQTGSTISHREGYTSHIHPMLRVRVAQAYGLSLFTVR